MTSSGSVSWLMDGRDCFPSVITRTTMQQRHAEGARCCASKDCTPPSHPSSLLANTVSLFQPPANLGGKDHQTCATKNGWGGVRHQFFFFCQIWPMFFLWWGVVGVLWGCCGVCCWCGGWEGRWAWWGRCGWVGWSVVWCGGEGGLAHMTTTQQQTSFKRSIGNVMPNPDPTPSISPQAPTQNRLSRSNCT